MAEFIQKHKLFSFYSTLMLLVVLIAIFAPWLAPGDAFSSNLSQALQAPSSQHWFGTDKLGRDVLSRIIYGTQLSLFMGVSIVVIMVSIGTIIGAVAGYFWRENRNGPHASCGHYAILPRCSISHCYCWYFGW